MHKQKIFVLLLISLSLLGVIIVKRTLKHKTTRWTVGILQTATHPALNAVQDAFVDTLQQTLGNDVNIIIQNAEGSVNNMQAMAQSLRSNNAVDLLFGIATPAAQALTSLEKEKPIIFAAVTDPGAAGLIKPGVTNVTGVTDMIDVRKQIELLQLLIPSARTVALIFNRGEINSLALAAQIKTELNKLSINVIEFGVINEAEIPAAMQTACRKADVVLAPTDNTVASAIKVITSSAHRMHKPVIVSDAMLVAQGALAAQGIDYAQCGKQAAHLALALLKDHKQPSELPIVMPESKAVLNKQEFDKLHLTLPAQIKQQIEFVTSEGL